MGFGRNSLVKSAAKENSMSDKVAIPVTDRSSKVVSATPPPIAATELSVEPETIHSKEVELEDDLGVDDAKLPFLTDPSPPEDTSEDIIAALRLQNEQLEQALAEHKQKAHSKVEQGIADGRHKFQQRVDQALSEEAHRHQQQIRRMQLAQTAQTDEYNLIIQRTREKQRLRLAQLESTKTSEINSLREHYELRLEKRDETIKALQARDFASVEAPQWAPEPPGSINRQLNSLFASVKQWVGAYLCVTLDTILAKDKTNKLGAMLHEAGCTSTADYASTSYRGAQALRKPGKPAAPILTALLTSQICMAILDNAFFAFAASHEPADQKKEALQPFYFDHGHGVAELCNLIALSDEPGAQAWRCQLLRLLDPMTNLKDPAVEKMKKRAAVSRKVAAETTANDHFTRLSVMFNWNDEPAARQKLNGVCIEAANLSWKLWTQKARIRVLNGPRLLEHLKQTDSLKFNSASPLLEAHPTHAGDLEDDAKALDGRPVWLLCQPAIVSIGGDDSRSPDVSVLSKAVVWMT